MSREFPDLIDPWKAAEGRREFHGTMPLKRMERLTPLLSSSEGEASFDIFFYVDRQKNVVVDIKVEAGLVLLCQRSLKPYTEQVRRNSRLIVIRDETEEEFVPENYEPVLAENGKKTLWDLVEEELILAVPQVPKNPAVDPVEVSTDGEVRIPVSYKDEPKRRPFAGLAGMLKKNE